MTAGSSATPGGASGSDVSVSTYRLSLAHLLRILAPAAMIVGVAWLVCAVAGVLDTVGIALAGITLVVVVVAAVLVLRPPRVLRLSDEGYEVSLARGTGERGAPWQLVEGVVTRSVHGTVCLVVTLEGGATSAVPLSLLGRRSLEAQREVHERLNQAHGYRRLDP